MTAAEAFGRLGRGVRVVALSKGAVSFGDAVRYVLEAAGPADLTLATWTVSADEIGAFKRLLDGGAVRRLRLLLDASFVQRHPAYTALLRATYGADCVRLAVCHAKLGIVMNERRAFVVSGLANLNRNSRLEFFSVEENRQLARALARVLGTWFRTPAGGQWEASRAEQVRRLQSWTGGDTRPRGRRLAVPVESGELGTCFQSVAAPAALTPALPADARYFDAADPWGQDLNRAGVSYLR